MLNKMKIFFYTIIMWPFIMMAHDLSLHMYIGSQTFDVWQEFDPAFYNALVDAQAGWQQPVDLSLLMLIKFYYIGLTLPDLLWPSGQEIVKGVVSKLYGVSGLVDPLRILPTTYNNVQTPIQFSSGDNSHNLTKLYQMVQYAKNRNWPPAQKALIYGAFIHVVQDMYVTFQQASRFGYGKCYDSDSALSQPILRYAETYHELFSQTYITDWGRFIRPLFATPLKEGPFYKQYIKDACTFFRIIEVYGAMTGWQDTNFVEVQRFVNAANAVGWSIQNLTQERLESYLHGWAIFTFLFYGYTKDNYSGTVGGIFGHPNWGFTYIRENFWWKIGLQGVSGLVWDIFHLPGWLRDRLLDIVATKEIYKLRFLAFLSGTESWYKYFQTQGGLWQLWQMVPDSLKTADAWKEYHRAYWNLHYWQGSGAIKNPRLRSSYNDEASWAVEFKNLYKNSVNQGPSYLDLRWNNLDVWTTARKAGLLGGLYDVNDTTAPMQPGVIDLHYFYIDANNQRQHTYTFIETEATPYGGIEWDLILFPAARNHIYLYGRKSDGSVFQIGFRYYWWNGLERQQGYLTVNLDDAVNAGAEQVFWKVHTQSDPTAPDALMLKADYRDAYQESPLVYNNKTYQQWFNFGDPTRILGQNPLTNPLKYWPSTVRLYRLNRPVNLSCIQTDPTHVKLQWTDRTNRETRFWIARKVENGSWNETYASVGANTTQFIDEVSFYNYAYKVRADDGAGHYSAWSDSIIFRGMLA